MIDVKELRKIARARLKDSNVLLLNKRYDGAVYLCGYAVEISLKVRVCKTLRWKGFPTTSGEFQNYKSFRTHDLDTLLHLSGVEEKIKTNRLADWSIIAAWEPGVRYKPIGTATKQDAEEMIQAAEALLGAL